MVEKIACRKNGRKKAEKMEKKLEKNATLPPQIILLFFKLFSIFWKTLNYIFIDHNIVHWLNHNINDYINHNINHLGAK